MRAILFRLQRGVSVKAIVLVLSICCLLPVGVFFALRVASVVLEFDEPTIKLVDVPRGIGMAPSKIIFEVKDVGAGLDAVVVRAQQREKPRVLFKKEFTSEKSATLEIELSPREEKYAEGVLELQIRAFDRSYWSNSSEEVVRLVVDYTSPSLKPLNTDLVIQRGGSQLVFYEVDDANLVFHGVRVGNNNFPGVAARFLDSSFETKNLYCSIFGDDLVSNFSANDFKLLAEDMAGNVSAVHILKRISKPRFQKLNVELDDNYVKETLIPLLEDSKELFDLLADEEERQEVSLESSVVIREVFDRLEYISDLELRATLSLPARNRMWEKHFLLQPGKLAYDFGAYLKYLNNGQEILSSRSNSLRLIQEKDSEVIAVNDGIVIASDRIGVYGNILAIDHGMNLASVYGFLGTKNVNPGDRVARGQVIGKIGDTGIGSGQELLIAFRLNTMTVNPREWFDRKWHDAHIKVKINSLKAQLGIPTKGSARGDLLVPFR